MTGALCMARPTYTAAQVLATVSGPRIADNRGETSTDKAIVKCAYSEAHFAAGGRLHHWCRGLLPSCIGFSYTHKCFFIPASGVGPVKGSVCHCLIHVSRTQAADGRERAEVTGGQQSLPAQCGMPWRRPYLLTCFPKHKSIWAYRSFRQMGVCWQPASMQPCWLLQMLVRPSFCSAVRCYASQPWTYTTELSGVVFSLPPRARSVTTIAFIAWAILWYARTRSITENSCEAQHGQPIMCS